MIYNLHITSHKTRIKPKLQTSKGDILTSWVIELYTSKNDRKLGEKSPHLNGVELFY